MTKPKVKLRSPPSTSEHFHEDPLKLGAKNLIEGCFTDVFNKTILIVAENPQLGWYDAAAPASVEAVLIEMGATVKRLMVGAPENHAIEAVQVAIDSADEVIFFARIGDQGRFKSQYHGARPVMSYALNAGMLASGYGRLRHGAMMALKNAIDTVTLGAYQIEITCPLGTYVKGTPGTSITEGGEVTVSRFPMGVPKPVLNNDFNGVVKLTNYLTPAGSKVYEPTHLELPSVITAHIEGTSITNITGEKGLVEAFKGHYKHVAAQFGLDAFYIDSWHAGIHPLFSYDMLASKNPVRWSQTVFPSPRFLHFHTCGAGPPGEICWMVLDPTISIDGVALWENGRLHPERFTETMDVLRLAPELTSAFATPIWEVGLGNIG